MSNLACCGELVARCFQARTDAHFAHLSTHSYAAHKALEEFYNGIVDLADTFAEATQGRHGALLKYPAAVSRSSASKPDAIVHSLRDWIDANRKDCTEDSELQNMIDEIVGFCDGIIYKLEFLS